MLLWFWFGLGLRLVFGASWIWLMPGALEILSSSCSGAHHGARSDSGRDVPQALKHSNPRNKPRSRRTCGPLWFRMLMGAIYRPEFSLELQIAQSRSYSNTLGPKVGVTHTCRPRKWQMRGTRPTVGQLS